LEVTHLGTDVEKLLSHADEGVRGDAVLAVELFKIPSLQPEIARRLEDPGARVRWSAVRVLHRFADKTYRPDVTKRLNDTDRDVRELTTLALPAFEGGASAPAVIPDGEPSFHRLSSPQPFVHGAYARMVVRALDDLDASTHWSTALTLGPLPARFATDDLAALLSHSQADVRRSAVWILDHWGSSDALRILRRASEQEKDPAVRKTMQDALSRAEKK
jgi:HEAT repeat protein